MGKGISIGDTVAITATVRRRVLEDRVSVSIPSYNFPHSIRDTSKVKRGQKIELQGEVTRVDDEKVTVVGPDLGITVGIEAVKLVEKYRAPKRKVPLRDKVD
ncbi:MAG: hypothetical protein E5X35_11380 [Mesorhizobium sp.]|uniref:hypothetical protein n=1 Tax=unclassified Mesorhizobium TaxID=325217 RepID=UPI000FCABAC4|nr:MULTISPECIES: hypothetical protein [unclassified Mesorhizobium]RUV65246.1 hypothetical protein EOA85_00350 [Mesorhizobium sp. M5C.F.Ca.IN.020.29.1.1]TIM84411.1 MAG: hypothetical protein E5Y50_22275 [Mesorhizobium sp.]TIR33262.1 MAG: hypothetical protein E5X35_11380 [Mesorhizobium sp.]